VQDTDDGLPAGSFGGSVDAQFDEGFQSGSALAAHGSNVAFAAGGGVSSMSGSGSGSGTVFAEFPSAFSCMRAGGAAEAEFAFTVTAPIAYSVSGSATESASSAFAYIALSGPGGDLYVLDSLGGVIGSSSGTLSPGGYVVSGFASATARVSLLGEGTTSGTEDASFSFSLTLGGP
jgi:hypothetical protein